MTGWRWNALRALFLLAVLAGTWWSWRNSGDEVERALADVDAATLVLAFALVLAGLTCTGWVWSAALRAFAVETRIAELLPLFFMGQLGKYIPGSVWSFAAQAVLGKRHGLRPKASAAASLLFLGIHVASGLLLAGAVGWGTQIPAWLLILSLVIGVIGLVPGIYRLLGTRLAGEPCEWTWRRSAVAGCLMLPAWTGYGLSLVVLSPSRDASTVLTLVAAFAIAHAAGVALPIAPAGLGAREFVLVALITPVVGIGQAAALALVLRLLHALADFLVAGVSWVVIRLLDRRGTSERPAIPH